MLELESIHKQVIQMIKQQTQALLNKEMDRKDFLKHVGIAALLVTGVSAVIGGLGQVGRSNVAVQSRGYGGSPYGG